MKHHRPAIWGIAVFLGVALTIIYSLSLAEPNTGNTPQKTEKQCKDERAKCLKGCGQLIDIDNNIQRCKDRCTDAYIICTPIRGTLPPGNKFGTTRPFAVPKQDAPIMRRGVEEDQTPTGKTKIAPEEMRR